MLTEQFQEEMIPLPKSKLKRKAIRALVILIGTALGIIVAYAFDQFA